MTSFDLQRTKQLNTIESKPGVVLYWMSRDQRVQENWALIFAQETAKQYGSHVEVIFYLDSKYPKANIRSFDFMLKGLEETENELAKYGIPFHLQIENPENGIPKFLQTHNYSFLITDFSPLRYKQKLNQNIAKEINIPFVEVDTHNIIPCWEASDKKEFSARTFRLKIQRILADYLTPFAEIKKQRFENLNKINWTQIRKDLITDNSVKPIKWLKPGYKEAKNVLDEFINTKLMKYTTQRNDPNCDVLSNLSPYLHFGQISAQQIALVINEEIQIRSNSLFTQNASVFLEELIVRKELSDNFCFFETNYDNFAGFHTWAQTTLNDHLNDEREFEFSQSQFEKAQTYDDLWNTAQIELVKTGKMHGYMRMFWAKKILEWSKNPQEAQKIAIYLNDKYSLDGRDPNGYTAIAWSIGGIHDRAWFERPVYGKIRYMNTNGARKKFDVAKYIQKINKL